MNPNVVSYLNQGIIPLVEFDYNYSPTDLEQPRSFYVTCYQPPPTYIRPGLKARVALTTDNLKPSQYKRLPLYEITDVEGYKIFLRPLFRVKIESGQLPLSYTQTRISSEGIGSQSPKGGLPLRLLRDVHWGYGSPSAYLVLA